MWESKKRFRVLVAGRRWGKTTLAAIELIISALSKPDSLLWYVAPTFRQAKMICWKLIWKLLPPELPVKRNEAELSMTFENGSVIELKGADNEDSLRGAGLDGMVVDEFATIYDNWAVWHEVLRPALADKMGWVLFIGTPKGKDAFYELFLRGERAEKDWQSWQFRTIDNLALDLAEEVEAARQESPERYFAQEFLASFEDYAGLVWPEFDEKLHVIDPIYLPKHYPRVGSIDPAMSGTTAVIKAAIDEDGRVIIYDEFYEQDKRVSETAKSIKEDSIRWIIDPASKAKNSQKDGQLYSLFDEYAEHGIIASPGENDVEAGINRVGEAFKTERIKIFRNCTNLIWELERYHWSESKESIGGITKPKVFKKDDHAVDALRYLVMNRMDGADLKIPQKPIPPDSPWGRYQAEKKKKKQRRFKYHARR